MSLTPVGRGQYLAECDRCETEQLDIAADTFMEAVDELKAKGWHPYMVRGEWQHSGPDCWEEDDD